MRVHRHADAVVQRPGGRSIGPEEEVGVDCADEVVWIATARSSHDGKGEEIGVRVKKSVEDGFGDGWGTAVGHVAKKKDSEGKKGNEQRVAECREEDAPEGLARAVINESCDRVRVGSNSESEFFG